MTARITMAREIKRGIITAIVMVLKMATQLDKKNIFQDILIKKKFVIRQDVICTNGIIAIYRCYHLIRIKTDGKDLNKLKNYFCHEQLFQKNFCGDGSIFARFAFYHQFCKRWLMPIV
jgi:hypothetical protein